MSVDPPVRLDPLSAEYADPRIESSQPSHADRRLNRVNQVRDGGTIAQHAKQRVCTLPPALTTVLAIYSSTDMTLQMRQGAS